MATGTLKRFFHDKGYGFIKLDGEKKDIFVHKTVDLEGEYKSRKVIRLSLKLPEEKKGLKPKMKKNLVILIFTSETFRLIIRLEGSFSGLPQI